MDQRIIDLYDRFTHGYMDRRSFMERLALIAGSAAAATALLPLLTNDYASAAIVAPDDKRLAIERTSYPAGGDTIKAYLARPAAGADKRPAVIVVHENRGLNPHIEDVARRFALAGFLALAPDLLSTSGGTPSDEDKARDMIGALDGGRTLQQLAAAVPFLEVHPASTGAIGAVGFCWGGAMVNNLATRSPDLKAAVAYYGRQPDAAAVLDIKAAVQLHYAGLDQGVNAGIETYEAALKAAGTRYELFIYEGANHAFNNDTNPARYDKDVAELAWGRTIAFLNKHLGGTAPD